MHPRSVNADSWLIGWTMAACLLPLWSGTPLFVLAAVAALFWGSRQPSRYFQYIWRVKWIASAIVLAQFFIDGLSLQALDHCVEPLARLSLLVGAMAALTARHGAPELLAALYKLSGPLSVLGLPRDRWALRLWLTLRYGERALAAGGGLGERLAALARPEAGEGAALVLTLPRSGWADGFWLALMAAVLVGGSSWLG